MKEKCLIVFVSIKKMRKSRLSEVQPKYVLNQRGLRVRKCCASCMHKSETNSDKYRGCLKHDITVSPRDVCNDWMMSRSLRMAMKSEDRIKRFDYLMFVLSVRQSEWEAEDQGQEVSPMSTEKLRAEFEQEHGSIYINF